MINQIFTKNFLPNNCNVVRGWLMFKLEGVEIS